MGMGLQYAVNLFSTLPKNQGGMVAVGSDAMDGYVESKSLLSKKEADIGFRHPQDSVDGKLEECSRDSIRKTMLKQEKMFKEQVSELHHLYQVQKALMAELGKELRLHSLTSAASGAVSDSKSGLRSSGSTSLTSHSPTCTDRPSSIPQWNSNNSFTQMVGPTAGPSLRAGLDVGLPVNKDYYYITNVSTIQSKSPNPKSQVHGRIGMERACLFVDDDAELDLTLSIGNGTNSRESREGDKQKGPPCDSALEEGSKPIILSDLTTPQPGVHNDTATNFDTEGVRQPPWFFQALSLNRT